MQLANEASLGGKVFEARARALFLGDSDLLDEYRTAPVKVRPDFSAVSGAVKAGGESTPLPPPKVAAVQAAALRLDAYCAKAGL